MEVIFLRNKKACIPDPNKYFTNHGTEFEIEYSPIVERDGTITLKESGKINIREYINSFKETTDISFIMKKLSQGDLSVLNQNYGQYGDFREVPTDPAQVLQYQINAERYFYSLSPEIRNKFNNSVTEFLREGQNESDFFFNALGIVKNQESEVNAVNAESAD